AVGPLAAAAPRVGHGEDAGAFVSRLGMTLVVEGVAGTAASTAGAVATLEHEALDDAVKDHPIVKGTRAGLARLGIDPVDLAGGEADEVGHGVGRVVFEEAHGEVAD